MNIKRMPIRSAGTAWAVLVAVGFSTSALAEGADATAPFLRVSTYRPQVGEAVRLTLDLPSGETWREVNVGRLIARSGNRQWTIPVEPDERTGAISVTFDQPGPALIVVSVGPSGEKDKSDAWRRTTHCTKVLLRVLPSEEDQTESPGAGIGGKVGERVEVLPLMDPTSMPIGGDLPVRVYHEGSKLADQTVRSFAPTIADSLGAAIQSKQTDKVGTTWFRIDRAGLWVIQFEREIDGSTFTGAIQFQIDANAGGGDE